MNPLPASAEERSKPVYFYLLLDIYTAIMYQRIVIKVGSNVLSKPDGSPHLERMEHLVDQIVRLRNEGKEIILVSSGAVAFGRATGWAAPGRDEIANRQVWSAIGQIDMVRTYQDFFNQHDTACAQVLVTRDDFRSRRHYLNMRQCFFHLLEKNITPVVNENDTVSINELMFTDNDELAGLVAAMAEAEALIILTSVAGVYTGDPEDEKSQLLEVIEPSKFDITSIQYQEKSTFGRGGMWTKVNLARQTAGMGIAVHIADGTREDILIRLMDGKEKHTYFVPDENLDGRKKWIAHSRPFSSANIIINAGAVRALRSKKATSLLPVGILEIKGFFEKGDVVRITDEENRLIALGRAEYSVVQALKVLGKNDQKPLVHYDYLYVV